MIEYTVALVLVVLFPLALYWRTRRPVERTCTTCAHNYEGTCRRFPPQRIDAGSTGFPAAVPAWFCGEYRRK